MENIGVKIAELSISKFNALPKTGKPKANEWTVLSCIVKEQNSTFEVVSLGTGSKCIGKSKMCPKGTVVNDSHAEVICRRAFLRYLYCQLSKESFIFDFDSHKKKYFFKPNVRFHFFTTHIPCGDAAIFPKELDEDIGDIVEGDVSEPLIKKRKIDDIFRTGAKCLKHNSKQDQKEGGAAYHVIGVVRTKPGRGDPTGSASCSDKLAKWCHLGIQGALLMTFLDKPVYLQSFTIINQNPFSVEALQRALFTRLQSVQLTEPYVPHFLDIMQVNVDFLHAKNEGKIPCSSSVSWFLNNLDYLSLEVVVNGRKQGITKRHWSTEKGRLKVCKLELFKTFIQRTKELNVLWDLEKLSYKEAKNLSQAYQENWQVLKKGFGTWTHKDPSLSQFLWT